jgi:hypothetical protein
MYLVVVLLSQRVLAAKFEFEKCLAELSREIRRAWQSAVTRHDQMLMAKATCVAKDDRHAYIMRRMIEMHASCKRDAQSTCHSCFMSKCIHLRAVSCQHAGTQLARQGLTSCREPRLLRPALRKFGYRNPLHSFCGNICVTQHLRADSPAFLTCSCDECATACTVSSSMRTRSCMQTHA